MALLQFEQGRANRPKPAEAAHKAASKSHSASRPRPASQGRLQVGLPLADLFTTPGKATGGRSAIPECWPKTIQPAWNPAWLWPCSAMSAARPPGRLNLLAEARNGFLIPQDPRLDQVAASWGLALARGRQWPGSWAPSPAADPRDLGGPAGPGRSSSEGTVDSIGRDCGVFEA